jgi:hypothetical protein
VSAKAKKFMAGRGNKIPIKKTVRRGGKSFQQTFWMSPADIKAMHAKQQKQDIDSLVGSKQVKKESKKKSKTLESSGSSKFAAGNFVEARKELARVLEKEGFNQRDSSTVVQVPTDLPKGVSGWHLDDGTIKLHPEVVTRAQKFIKDFGTVDKDFFREEAQKWSQAIKDGTPLEPWHPIHKIMEGASNYGVFVHETLHSYGPPRTDGAKAGEGTVVEELTTELLARDHFRQSLGFTPTMVTHKNFGQYTEWVSPVLELVSEQYKVSIEEAFDLLVVASKRYKKVYQQMGDRDAVSRAFINGLPDPEWLDRDFSAEKSAIDQIKDRLSRKLRGLSPAVFGTV